MTTFRRPAWFTARDTGEHVRTQFERDAREHSIEIVAYCFMPDHLHALICGTSEDAYAKGFFRGFRQRSGYRHHRRFTDRLWQEGYFDRHLRSEEATFDVVSYIVANPVRAGLCDSPEDYPYTGSSRYSLHEIAQSVVWNPYRSAKASRSASLP